MTEIIELRGGLLVRRDALELLLALENTGHACSVRDGRLVVSRGADLKPDVIESVKRLRLHLLALAAYEPPILQASP